GQCLFPALFPVIEIGVLLSECAVKAVDVSPNYFSFLQLGGRRDFELGLIHVIEKRVKLIILALGDRVVLVVVALRAADRQTKKDRSGGIHAINNRVDPELFDVDPPLLVDECIAMKTCSDSWTKVIAGEKITGELFGRKSIERHAGIDRRDDPVTVLP